VTGYGAELHVCCSPTSLIREIVTITEKTCGVRVRHFCSAGQIRDHGPSGVVSKPLVGEERNRYGHRASATSSNSKRQGVTSPRVKVRPASVAGEGSISSSVPGGKEKTLSSALSSLHDPNGLPKGRGGRSRHEMYGQCRHPELQHLPRSARNAAVKTNRPVPGSSYPGSPAASASLCLLRISSRFGWSCANREGCGTDRGRRRWWRCTLIPYAGRRRPLRRAGRPKICPPSTGTWLGSRLVAWLPGRGHGAQVG
jgi:hypothetical protein